MWLVLLSLGCKNDDAIIPTEGSWLIDQDSVAFSSDGCGLQTGLVFYDLIIDQLDADGFRFIDTNGDAFTCSLGAADFSCADLVLERDASARAALTFTSALSGTFSSETALERTLSISGVCEGSDCAELFSSVSFPCETTASMEAVYDGPADEIDSGFDG
ncbi:MAG: hypothetical protein ACI8S6_002740 [Myxococcota bacterium]|jgi:hypothetical protein